ncbi:hypothetical protein YKD1_39710 [Yersinia pseudotuberculosis]
MTYWGGFFPVSVSENECNTIKLAPVIANFDNLTLWVWQWLEHLTLYTLNNSRDTLNNSSCRKAANAHAT